MNNIIINSAERMTLQEFKCRFLELKARGFIPTIRTGPTGIGHTFEAILGLHENNLAIPDLEKIEIKTHRDDSSSMITLFTFNHKAWKMPPLEAIQAYGSRDSNGRLGMYYTVSPTPNSAGLFLRIDDHEVTVRHISGKIIVAWELKRLTERFIQKIPALLFISAQTELRNGREYFYFYRAQLMQGTTHELLGDLFKTRDLLIDLRLYNKGTMARNHGTGFRIFEHKLPKLFTMITDI